MKYREECTHDELLAALDYDSETGLFTWKPRQHKKHSDYKRRQGKPAGSVKKGSKTPHIRVKFNQVDYQAHRLAWFYVYGEWPIRDLDHHNGDPQDNRIVNLRLSTTSQNGMNRGPQKNNKCGLKGVIWVKEKNKWRALIKINKKNMFLGYFNCPAAASFAYQIASDKLHKEFGRTF
jgi:hypothetical protein